jgi:hypothetical protein
MDETGSVVTHNQGVLGSSPSGTTNKNRLSHTQEAVSFFIAFFYFTINLRTIALPSSPWMRTK